MALPLRLGVVYGFRNPPDSGIDNPRLYAEILEQVTWLEQLGLDLVWFTEHHFVEDGYLPSWIPVAGAMAARTQRLRFSTDICLLPFNHPVRLAEDLAVLDNLSNGRVEIGMGMGYAPHEFRGFGMPVSHRLSRTEEGIEILRRCFTGERFSFHGKRYQCDDVMIKPGYVQDGGPPLWLASTSASSAHRAAKFNCHLLPQGPRDQTLQPWLDDLTVSGRNPDQDQARMPQTWVVGDVDHCVTELSAFIMAHRITDLVTWAVPPGMRPEQMRASLERFASEVAPRLRAAVNVR